MTKKKPQTFRQLVDSKRTNTDPKKKPLTITQVAKRCRISRPHFYHLLAGSQTTSDHLIERLVAGLPASKDAVVRALSVSRRNHELAN